MYCSYCGEKIPDDSAFCPFCGAKFSANKYEADEAVNNDNDQCSAKASGTEGSSMLKPGFSDKINSPEIKAALKKNKRDTSGFMFILILAPIIITFILGIKNGDMSILGIGVVISLIFLIINLVSAVKKKSEAQWDGIVTDKKVETRKKKHTPDRDRDAHTTKVYIIQFRTLSGNTRKLEEPSVNHVYYDYLNVGDKVRFHPQFTCYYEKYDKTKDSYAICPICGRKNSIREETCTGCGVPVIK